MAKTVNQKGKILYLEKILKETQEGHPYSMQEILDRLTGYGIKAERKSIYDDMEVLRSFGMDIRFKRGKSAGYYVVESEKTDEAGKFIDSEASGEGASGKGQADGRAPFWLLPLLDLNEDDKPLKLVCQEERKAEIVAVLGENAQYREKDGKTFTALFLAKETPEFFGWLTKMGRDVVLTKPKKSVQAYREYLKGILKEYK